MKFMSTIVILAFSFLVMVGCSGPQADRIDDPSSVAPMPSPTATPSPSPLSSTRQDQSSASISENSDISGDYPPFFGTGALDNTQLPPSSSSDSNEFLDFKKKFVDGLFMIKLVDCNNIPVINAYITLDLDWVWHQEILTNADGEVLSQLPQALDNKFIEGEYEFEITQQQPDGSMQTEKIKSVLTEANLYPAHLLTLSGTSVAELFSAYDKKVTIEVLKNGAPAKNMLINISPEGVSYPDIGGGKRGEEAYTDNAGKAYFTSIADGEYSVVVYDNNWIQLKHVVIDVSENDTAIHVVNLE